MRYFNDALLLGLSLTTGNYFYQYINGQRWDIAQERSFFQVIALLIFAVIISRKQDSDS